MMPSLPKRPGVRARKLAAPAMVVGLGLLYGCPSNSSGPGNLAVTGVKSPVSASNQVSPPPQTPPVLVTPPPPANTGGVPLNAPPPSTFFATPTPTPTPTQTPTPEPLDVQIYEGSGFSEFSRNLFMVPAIGDLPHLDPPASRSYSAFNTIGIGPDLASRSGQAQQVTATASVQADWSISQIATLDIRPSTASLPTSLDDLLFFRLPNGATVSTVASADAVEIDVATVPSGELLTFSANVTASTQQALDGPASNSVTLQVVASNEGQVNFSISSLRLPQTDHLIP